MGNAIAPMVNLKNQNSNNNSRAQNIDNVHLKEKTVAIMKTNKIVKHFETFSKRSRALFFNDYKKEGDRPSSTLLCPFS